MSRANGTGFTGYCSLLICILLLAVAFAPARAEQGILERTRPSPLLGVALNRSAFIHDLAERWSPEVQRLDPTLARGVFEQALSGLRVDHLLAISTAKSPEVVLDMLASFEQETSSRVRPAQKALGSPYQDLVFTPVAPCRIVDTRIVGGAWVPGVPRTYSGYTPTDFSSQGGASNNCGIPFGVAALAIEAIALYPPADGWFYLWPGNIPQPASSTFNYGPALSVITFGTILPVYGAASNQFKANSSQAAYLIIDVVGYFQAGPTIPTLSSRTVAAVSSSGVGSVACGAGEVLVGGGCACTGSTSSGTNFGVVFGCAPAGNAYVGGCYNYLYNAYYPASPVQVYAVCASHGSAVQASLAKVLDEGSGSSEIEARLNDLRAQQAALNAAEGRRQEELGR